MGDYGGSIADWSKVIELNPNDASAYLIRGIVRARSGDANGAIADCDKAIELNPAGAGAYRAAFAGWTE